MKELEGWRSVNLGAEMFVVVANKMIIKKKLPSLDTIKCNDDSYFDLLVFNCKILIKK